MPAASTEGPHPAPRFAAAAGRALLHWYEAERRDLPWRRTTDPYRILVSEIMLQQTRVETVVPRYARFLQRFPDLTALASAAPDEVLAEWSGLGYYRRARSLHAAARAIVHEQAGEFPRKYGALRALPGIGDYTAAAVAAIAFGEPHVGIDGNVNRVLCRYFGVAEAPTRAAVRRQLTSAAASLLDEHAPGDVTQALMELGARVCTPKSPGCADCPLGPRCIAAAEGTQELLPVRRKQEIRNVLEAAGVVARGGRFLLARGQRPGVLADMWEFPTRDSRLRQSIVAEGDDDPADDLRRYLAELGQEVVSLRPVGEIRHGITSRRIACTVYRADSLATGARPAPENAELNWFTRAEARQLPLAASAKRIFELLQSGT